MLVIVETVQDQEEGRREVGCQWGSPEGDRREERREVGCQSESAESRDASVQVDLSWTPAGVCGNKRSTVTTEEKKSKVSRCREMSRPEFSQTKHSSGKDPNTVRRKRRRPRSTVRLSSSDENEDRQLVHCQDVPHPVEGSSITETQQSGCKTVQPVAQIQRASADRGKEEVQEEGGGIEPVKTKTKNTEQAVRSRRKMVGPPIRYLLESEMRSYSLSAANHSAKKVKMGKQRKEHEETRGGLELMETTDCSREESFMGVAADGWCQPCQVCGLMFTKEASLQLHLSVHGVHPWFSCHLCNKMFRRTNTLHVHLYRHHRGDRGGAPVNRGSHLGNKVTATANNQGEVEVNSKSDREEDREERSKEKEEKPLLQAHTMTPDWPRHINPRWCTDFQTQLQGKGGAKDRKRKRNREEEEEEEEHKVRQVCINKEGGGQEGQRRGGGREEDKEEVTGVHVKEDSGGEDAPRVRDGGEEKEEQRQTEVKKEVMEPPKRPRRMVGPPIRYLLESEQQSHGPDPAKQERRKPRKKSEAGGGASDDTEMIDRSVDAERQTGQTKRDTRNTPKQRRGRPINGIDASKAEGGASERQTDQMVTDRYKDYVVSERQTGHVVSERETGHVVSERETGHMVSDRQTGHVVSDRQTGHVVSDRQTGHVVSERETGHMVSDRQTGHVVSDRQTGHVVSERETGQMVTDRHKDYVVSERETAEYKNHYLVYRDLQTGQVTLILPCCVKLQRLL